MRHVARNLEVPLCENAAGVFTAERQRLMLYYEAGAFDYVKCLGGLTTSGKGNLDGV